MRNTIDQVIATVRQQFYTVILNKALIGVQEESVSLLESQLKDQQNRFEAGTVPRFNVLQAEVALANQQPALITARNNFRIAQIQLAEPLASISTRGGAINRRWNVSANSRFNRARFRFRSRSSWARSAGLS